MSVVVYYERGQVVCVSPAPIKSYYESREIINATTDIVSDGIRYDLTNRNSIYSIKVPQYTLVHKNPRAQELGTTGYLDYVLRMHAGLLWNECKYELAMACLEKACQLMVYSSISWQRKDFYRVVEWYVELGRFKKAKQWKDWIDRNTDAPEDISIIAFKQTIDSCKYLETDLVEVGDLGGMCEVCAKYRNRIYSLSGKIFKYPKFPPDFCFSCGLSVSPFVEGVMEPGFKCINKCLHSRRPFRDDRTKAEKENYLEIQKLREKAKYKERTANLNHIIYYWFKPLFPNEFPKSVGGFSRMRNSNSKNYQKLMAMVQSKGYKIPSSLEDVAEWEDSKQ